MHTSTLLNTEAGLLLLTLAQPASAESHVPRSDLDVVALDLHTGALLWSWPAKVGHANLEVHTQGLVVFPHYDGADRSAPIFLDAQTGAPVKPFATDATDLRALSTPFWPPPSVRLDNGWTLSGFSPGNSKELRFVDGRSERWVVSETDYPDGVRAWRSVVFYTYSYLSGTAKVVAIEAGASKPRWVLDLNAVLGLRGRDRLERVWLQVIDDTLYAEANEHLFALQPDTGQILWRLDLARSLGLRFDGGLFGGALNLASMAKEGEVLVVAFEKQVIAVDVTTRRVLWHLDPDTFPNCAFPAASGGVVYMVAGAARAAVRSTWGGAARPPN